MTLENNRWWFHIFRDDIVVEFFRIFWDNFQLLPFPKSATTAPSYLQQLTYVIVNASDYLKEIMRNWRTKCPNIQTVYPKLMNNFWPSLFHSCLNYCDRPSSAELLLKRNIFCTRIHATFLTNRQFYICIIFALARFDNLMNKIYFSDRENWSFEKPMMKKL